MSLRHVQVDHLGSLTYYQASHSINTERCNLFFSAGGPMRGNKQPDWLCQDCGNKNFGWREVCNRCQVMALSVHFQSVCALVSLFVHLQVCLCVCSSTACMFTTSLGHNLSICEVIKVCLQKPSKPVVQETHQSTCSRFRLSTP